MAFKMKGSSLYGKINLNRGGQANRPDGRAKSSSFQKTGGFITDVDELTGEKTTRRATYDETRAAEKEGKETTYTNREFNKRMDEDISNAKKGIGEDGKPIGTVNNKTGSEANEIMAKSKTDAKNYVNKYTKENKQSAEQIEDRKQDYLAQQELEIAAENEKYKSGKKHKATIREFKPLNKQQKEKLANNKKSGKVDTSKPNTSGSTYHVGKGENRDEEVKKAGAPAIWPFKKKIKGTNTELVKVKKKKSRGKKIRTTPEWKKKLSRVFNKTTKKISDKIKEPGKKGNRPGFD